MSLSKLVEVSPAARAYFKCALFTVLADPNNPLQPDTESKCVYCFVCSKQIYSPQTRSLCLIDFIQHLLFSGNQIHNLFLIWSGHECVVLTVCGKLSGKRWTCVQFLARAQPHCVACYSSFAPQLRYMLTSICVVPRCHCLACVSVVEFLSF